MTTATSARPPIVTRGERGQVLVMFIAVISVVFVAAAIAVDYGFWLSERRGLARAADLSALAAVQDLPPRDVNDDPITVNQVNDDVGDCGGGEACENAFRWAERNGYEDGANGVEVTVEFWCGNTIPVPHNIDGVCENNFPGALSPCTIGCDAIRIAVSRPAIRLFSGFFGTGPAFDVGYRSWGSVSFKVIPLDSAIGMDATGSMQGNPIQQARIAANNFVDVLLDGSVGLSQVGYAPYRDCYGGGACVPNSSVIQLTTNKTTLHNGINATNAQSATNICVGLSKLNEIVTGPNASTDENARKFAVILTDGDNYYQGASNPAAPCRPNPAVDSNNANCTSSTATERNMDELTYDMAEAMKDPNGDKIEIYVIGFSVCGSENNNTFTPAQCDNLIGNADGDNTADRRLLKCMASSTAGTNDHYYETDDANELGNIFQVVAYEIAGGGLTTGPP